MNQTKITLKPLADKYEIILPAGTPLQTHMHTGFPPLAKDIAEILAVDLQLNKDIILYAKYNFSWVYCLLSTLTLTKIVNANGDAAYSDDFYIDLDTFIQWDSCYRLSPGPSHSAFQMELITPLRELLGDKYRDYPLNYCESIEEMATDKDYDTEFVSDEITKVFVEIEGKLNRAERFMVLLLNDLHENFSITLTIMLVNRQITPSAYFKTLLCFLEDNISQKLSRKDSVRLKKFEEKISNIFRALDSGGIKEFL